MAKNFVADKATLDLVKADIANLLNRGVIKNVQFGFANLSSNRTINHGYVNKSKSFVILKGADNIGTEISLTSRTNTSFMCNASAGSVSWFVVEFY